MVTQDKIKIYHLSTLENWMMTIRLSGENKLLEDLNGLTQDTNT